MKRGKKKDEEVKAKANTSAPSENNNSEAQNLGLEPMSMYKVIAIVKTKYFKDGQEMEVLGKLAEKMINNNQAKLKQ